MCQRYVINSMGQFLAMRPRVARPKHLGAEGLAGAGLSKSGGGPSSHGMEDPPKSECNNLCLYARFEQAKIRERSEREVRREELANCTQRALSTFTRLRENITYVILLLHCTFGFGDRNLLLVWFVYVNTSGSCGQDAHKSNS